MSEQRLSAEHGTVCFLPDDRHGYFGWPSVARTASGKLVAAASGPRFDHVCPWGKTSIFESTDEGRTWSGPNVINNTPLDDRDAGIISLGGERLLVSWFVYDVRSHFAWARESYKLSDGEIARWQAVFDTWSDEVVRKWQGSWVRTSSDGCAWSDFYPVPVSAPHGPIRLADGSLLYLGKEFPFHGVEPIGQILACRSTDDGKTWTTLGRVPLADDTHPDNFHEPHMVELPSGKLLGMIRYEYAKRPNEKYISFSLFQTESEDGGKTWSPAKDLRRYGSPPHLIRHSSGAVVCVYSYRKPPLGHRVIISRDEGAVWSDEYILRDDAPPRDHGYPASIELPSGEIFTVYYQRADHEHKNCAILWSRWRLP